MIALDIDGVLADTRAAHKRELERELGVTLTDGGDYASFGFTHSDAGVMARLREVALTAWQRPTVFVDGAVPIEGAQAAARQFHQRGLLAGYVTRRHPDLRPGTQAWLRAHGFPAAPLHHMVGDTDSKAAYVFRLGADVMIEDSPREALLLAEDGVRVVLLDRPYNREMPPHPNIKRAVGWYWASRTAQFTVAQRRFPELVYPQLTRVAVGA